MGTQLDPLPFMGRLAGYSATDVEDLTNVELRSRALAVAHLEIYRAAAPGFSDAFLMLGAPQIGVRHSRRLAVPPQSHPRTMGYWTYMGRRNRCVAFRVPYGSLIPDQLDNILGAGRHIACDASPHTFLREIPQCWLTGQAAGVAASIRR